METTVAIWVSHKSELVESRVRVTIVGARSAVEHIVGLLDKNFKRVE